MTEIPGEPTDRPDDRVAPGDPDGREHGLALPGGAEVARYVFRPEVEAYLSPRPYLHPVRTPAGTVVTDAAPVDHRWHLGVSVACQDVSGNNLWGGRTYVRDRGYTMLDDHGLIRHTDWAQRDPAGFGEELEWVGRDGTVLLAEHRDVAVGPAGEAWRLDFRYQLRNVTDRSVLLGSPGTNGRENGGYGGFFWRAPASAAAIDVFTPDAAGEDEVHGRVAPWFAFAADAGSPSSAYTLVFLPGDNVTAADPWFVRTRAYPGICSAVAYRDEVVLAPGATLARHIRVLVADGRMTREGVVSLVRALEPPAVW